LAVLIGLNGLLGEEEGPRALPSPLQSRDRIATLRNQRTTRVDDSRRSTYVCGSTTIFNVFRSIMLFLYSVRVCLSHLTSCFVCHFHLFIRQ
jgi:hypothetical protein